MAVQMFMRVDGVAGGATHFHYRDWSEITSWNWALEHRTDKARPGEAAQTRVNEISVVKAAGIDSPALMSLCATGKRIGKVEISVVPVVGKREAQQKYITLVLENAVIRSIATGGSAEEAIIREKIGLQFGSIRYEFHTARKVESEGAAAEASECFSFDWNVAVAASAASA